ncbi:uncharacterized protein BJ171DRAFT_411608, partial [Polychytrium aggregatum]|uniref:uncharacterized protein n=1 Tax=Polychytrium aggregatum TaxID=110093 RepID=UPI0022FE1485
SVAASANGQWVSGQATHYGPFPQFPAWSEPGFQPGAVGVGCASSSNDPRWNAILSGGLLPNPDLPANAATVWPVEYVVAVSEAVYGGAKKDQYCFQKITIRNSNDHSKQITATIVDFCPAGSCLWSANALAHNVDLYGGAAWQALGGATLDGSINIDIIWPGGM